MLSKVDLQSKLEATLSSCGRMWISTDRGATFSKTEHYTNKVGGMDVKHDTRTVFEPHETLVASYWVPLLWTICVTLLLLRSCSSLGCFCSMPQFAVINDCAVSDA